MKKRIRFFEFVFSFVLVVALIHLVVHLSVFSGERGASNKGFSGLIAGESKVGEELEAGNVWASFSKIFVIIEWSLVGIIILFLHFRNKVDADTEYEEVKKIVTVSSTSTETDLDKLYEVLKVRKTIRLSTISKVFNVNKEVALDWCKTLEMGNFASIEYPRFGEPQLVLEEPIIEERKGGENEQEK